MPDIASIFDREAGNWDAEHGPDSQRAAEFRARSLYLHSVCDQLSNPRVLDLGCGTGRQLLDLDAVIEAGVGIDISPNMIVRARENAARSSDPALFEFKTCDIAAATSEQFGLFGLAQFVGSLEHAPDPFIHLAAASKLLCRDGKLVVIMPHPWNPGVFLLRLNAEARRGAPYRHFTTRQLRRLAAPLGLRLESVHALPFCSSVRRERKQGREWPIVSGAYAACFGKSLS